MSDIYQRDNDAFGGTFAADGATVTFDQFFANGRPGAGVQQPGAGLLVQNLNTQYNQMVTKIYEVGTRNIYYVGGRTQGSTGLSRILGPRPIQLGFYQKFADVCDAASNTISVGIAQDCPTQDGRIGPVPKTYYTQNYCVIMSLGMSVTAQDSIINEQIQMMFGSMSLATD